MVNIGIITEYLCENPSCEYSSEKLVHKQPVYFKSKKAEFEVIKSCPKCRASLELLNFKNADVEIKEIEVKKL